MREREREREKELYWSFVRVDGPLSSAPSSCTPLAPAPPPRSRVAEPRARAERIIMQRRVPQQPSFPPPEWLRTAAAREGSANADTTITLFTVPDNREIIKEGQEGLTVRVKVGGDEGVGQEGLTVKVKVGGDEGLTVKKQDRDRTRSPARSSPQYDDEHATHKDADDPEAVAAKAWHNAITLHGAWVLAEDAATRAHETSMRASATAEFAVTAFQSAIAAAQDLGAPTCESARHGLADAIAWP